MTKTLMIGLTPPLEGGSERHIYELSSRIEDGTVLTQRLSLCKNKIELPIISNKTFIRNTSFFISSLFYTFILLLTPRKKYKTIHIHENLLYFLAPLLKLRYKVIITIHGIKGFNFYDNKFLWALFKQPLKFADIIIAVNPIDKKVLEKEFKKVIYIPNGVDLTQYGLKIKTENKIAFIGRIHEQKGIIYLLQAFQEINKKYPKFKLEIIGEINEYAKELQKKFPNKNIIWRGYLSDRKEITRALKSSYCIALPSVWEGLPLTLFEALASSRPVVLSDIPAFKTIIKSEAQFFKAKNSKDLESKIISLIKNEKISRDFGKKGKKLSEKYDWDNIAKTLEKVYKNE